MIRAKFKIKLKIINQLIIALKIMMMRMIVNMRVVKTKMVQIANIMPKTVTIINHLTNSHKVLQRVKKLKTKMIVTSSKNKSQEEALSKIEKKHKINLKV